MSSESPRRSPVGESRQRDAERTRRAILDAAVVEFSRYGYAGARVGRISERAGINKQLISYYFGGKQGLRDAVNDDWRATQPSLYPEGTPLAEVAANYVRANADRPDLVRLLVWEAMGDYGSANIDASRAGWMQHFVQDVRTRQGTGELPSGVDPRAIALVIFAAAAAPIVFSPIAAAMGIDEPSSTATGDWYAGELGTLIRALGAKAPPAGG